MSLYDKIYNAVDNGISNALNTNKIDKNSITVIMQDNTEMSLSEIDRYNRDDVVFIKFSNIKNCKHPIIIHKLLVDNSELWSYDEIESFDNSECIQNKIAAERDYNGYEHTYMNKNIDDYSYYPALQYCHKLYRKIYMLDYKAYLPAMGELKFLRDNIEIINDVLAYLNCKKMLNMNSIYWSSTEYDDEHAWMMRRGDINHNGSKKHYVCNIIPLFKKIN